MLTRDLLNELFWYDDEIGQLRWRVKTCDKVKVDKVAGGITDQGYRSISVGGKHRLAHRLIWIMLVGDIPHGFEIDHIDEDPSNNRITNLRLATHAENLRNVSLTKRNTSGTKGVSFCKFTGRWRVVINRDGQSFRKRFASKELAEAFVKQLRENVHGDFANHGVNKCNSHKDLV